MSSLKEQAETFKTGLELTIINGEEYGASLLNMKLFNTIKLYIYYEELNKLLIKK